MHFVLLYNTIDTCERKMSENYINIIKFNVDKNTMSENLFI